MEIVCLFWILLYIFLSFISVASCVIHIESFENNLNLVGKTCPLSEQLFTKTGTRKIACVGQCLQWTACKGVVYTPKFGLCTGCKGEYHMSSDMLDTPGSVFYTAVSNEIVVDCGTPSVTSEHVVLGTFSGDSSLGAKVEYKCTPCTFFATADVPTITCQSDSSWSTPECLYGPDVGYLANGAPIAGDEKGCGHFYPTTCPQRGLSGNVLRHTGVRGDCYCDNECCLSQDCCFDSTCAFIPPT